MTQTSLTFDASLDDICRPNHGGSPESEAANTSIAASKASIRNRVWQYLKESRGSTSDEIEVALGLSHQTASARLTELRAEGRAYKSILRRETRSVRLAAVICVSAGVRE